MDQNDEKKLFSVHLEIAAKINFACHQNAFPILKSLRIENNSETERFEELTVTLSANPAFLKPKIWQIDRIEAGGSITISKRDVELDGSFLLQLVDSMRGTLEVRIQRKEEILFEKTRQIELLARNEWGGAGFMPELLAAFVMPNDPAIDKILRRASELLRRAGKKDSLEGYQSKSRQRVWEIVSAIYSAIANLDLTYAEPPASFEANGQKIRTPSQIMESRIATCLDTSILFASAFEQAGLNSIVAMPKDHALVGVWLQPEELATIVIDEAETLRKRVQLQELILIETTYATAHPSPPCSKAMHAAHVYISPEKDSDFVAAVDIKRARMHRISPLGLLSTEAKAAEETSYTNLEIPFEEAPSLPQFDTDEVTTNIPDTPQGRLERWQRRLLDLTLRNPLLHHRVGKTSLRLLCPEPGNLEDKLAQGARIAIHSVPQPTTQAQDESLFQQRTGENITVEYARESLARNQVLVDLSENELTQRAVEIYRKAQTALQEGGSNTLYLALGFLLWKRKEKDDRRFRAPLILLPVSLERKSVRSGVKLLAHDDEPRFNTTLLEMLRKDFGVTISGLDGELPADQSGIDVNGIWTIVRKAIKDVPGFEVIEEIVLGHFSFAKYLMWKDLVDRTDALRQNPVVRHLIDTPRDPYSSDIEFVKRDSIDRDFKPSDLLTPLPADASQMSAIATAERGKDFVIIGPPGTGKSQTISNMIAHLLGKGKTVLFVSEKTAALEVVYRRLRDVGLGRFCLELHSNKARKIDVLNQLRGSWEGLPEQVAEVWNAEARKLCAYRDQLNQLVDCLHKKRSNGLSAHYAIGVKVRDAAIASHVKFSWPSADCHDVERLETMRSAVDKLAIQATALGDASQSPFSNVEYADWSPQWEAEMVKHANRLSSAAQTVEQAYRCFCETIGISSEDQTVARIEALAELATILLAANVTQLRQVLDPNGQDFLEKIKEASVRLKSYAERQATLSCPYEAMAWQSLDGRAIEERWRETESHWWLKRFLTRRNIIKEMKKSGAQGEPDPARDAMILKSLREEGEAIGRLNERLSGLCDWKGYTSDPVALHILAEQGRKFQAAVAKLANGTSDLIELRGKLKTLLEIGYDLLSPEAAIGKAGEKLLVSQAEFFQAHETFAALAGKPKGNISRESEGTVFAIKESADCVAKRHSELKDWCAWLKRRNEAIDCDLLPLVEAIEQKLVPGEIIRDVFEAAYCTWWSGAVIGEDEVLRTFSTPEHTAVIQNFREIDQRFQKSTSAYIAAKLSGKLPGQENVARSSQWGILRNELQKKTRHKPVRQLVREIPDVLTTLAPCLMMSPLSVAQYLPPDQKLFDVVIFDEASQITVWDAVGAIARGRQVIIAGDPKQMPPTNFFARSEDDPDGDVDQEGDLESILDEMLGASIPQRMLNLHYRSQKESLIAFSNTKYYDNNLITFPAPLTPPDRGVALIRPAGFYARGKARHNEGEAKAIVVEVVRRLTHFDPAIRDQSIGIVTFNSEQQSLIENLLDEARSRQPEIEWAFSFENVLEPVFVKNLETVQGDERDVILFSITYGPDQSGHMTMNFGPLNREGGERRLNVALTRARSEMVVFSTLHPDSIDLARTRAQAVTDLKHFLEYAERGPSTLGTFVNGPLGDFESPFETAVARALKEKGWQVLPQIGVSAYRIDLGIVHPDEPGFYLAGVECDGAMYHSSAYARERDKIRQSVLERLGWTLFRVWSTDWWTNKAKATDVLHGSLQQQLEISRKKRKEKEAAAESLLEDEITVQENSTVFSEHLDEFSVQEVDSESKEAGLFKRVTDAPDLEGLHHYKIVAFEDPSYVPDPQLFYNDDYKSRLIQMIEHVIDSEGPIHEDILIRRIARHHGFQRTGNQIKDIVLTLAQSQRKSTQEKHSLFFWPRVKADAEIIPARFEGRDSDLKKPEYICTEEICMINKLLSLNDDPTEMARTLGIGRLSQSARKRIEEALG